MRYYSIHPILILIFTTQLKMYKTSVQKEIIQYIAQQFNHVKKKKKKKPKKKKNMDPKLFELKPTSGSMYKNHGSESILTKIVSRTQ